MLKFDCNMLDLTSYTKKTALYFKEINFKVELLLRRLGIGARGRSRRHCMLLDLEQRPT